MYKKAFHLEVDWQGKDEKTNFIYHTEARIGNQRIRLSDGGTGKEIQADSLFFAVDFDSVAEAWKVFDRLLIGRRLLAKMPFREFRGMLTL